MTVLNKTDLPTPTWVERLEGRYIEALIEIWRTAIMDEFERYSTRKPKDLDFGVVLYPINDTPFFITGNALLVNPCLITKEVNRSRSFKKRYRMDRDIMAIKKLAQAAFMRWASANMNMRTEVLP